MIEDDILTEVEVLCELEQIWKNAAMTKHELLSGL
jgi:hypothetical protein